MIIFWIGLYLLGFFLAIGALRDARNRILNILPVAKWEKWMILVGALGSWLMFIATFVWGGARGLTFKKFKKKC